MKTAGLVNRVRVKLDELYPNYNSSAVFSVSNLENPIEAYIKDFLNSCIPQLIKDAPLEKLDSITGEWAIVSETTSYIKSIGNNEIVVSFDTNDKRMKVEVHSAAYGYDLLINRNGVPETPTLYIRNILLTNGKFFRKVHDGFDSKDSFYHEHTALKFGYNYNKTPTFTDVVLPSDYVRFVSIETKKGLRPISELSPHPSEFYKMQFSAAKNGYVRPVAFQTTERNIRVFPADDITDFRYIPKYLPEEVPDILVDAYTWLCAGQILAQMNAKTANAAIEFYKAAL